MNATFHAEVQMSRERAAEMALLVVDVVDVVAGVIAGPSTVKLLF
jgi:hypothetical protein